MTDALKRRIRLGLIVVVVTILASYAYFQAHDFVVGPQLTLTNPVSGNTATDPLLTVTGVAKNISAITLDDRPILIDESGRFEEKLLLSYGYNIIKVAVKDRFGRAQTKTAVVIYQ